MKSRILFFCALFFLFGALCVSAAEPPKLKAPQVTIPKLNCENGVCVELAQEQPCKRVKRLQWFPRLRKLCHKIRTNRRVWFPNAWWRK